MRGGRAALESIESNGCTGHGAIFPWRVGGVPAYRPPAMSHRRAVALAVALAVPLVAAVPAGFADTPPLTVSTNIILLKDDHVAPIDLKNRYVKLISRTKLDPVDHQIAMAPAGSAGDPTPAGATGGGATLTVYNPITGESFTIALPASRWIREGSPVPLTYRFADGHGPVIRAIVRPYKIYIRGGGPGWGFAVDGPQGRIAYRLTLGTGITWCAEAPARPPLATNDRQDKFIGARTEAPVVCPPLPGS